MSFILIIVAVSMISMTLKKYKKISSTVFAIFLLYGSTIIIFFYGTNVFETSVKWHLMGKDITADVFYRLIAALFVVNIICSVIIVRNHLEYRKVNRVNKTV